MHGYDRTLKAILGVIALFLGMIAIRPLFEPAMSVQAQSARFDHIHIVSAGFPYKGQQGLLVMDKRNGNVWFIPRMDDQYKDPIFLIRVPFEKLDQSPQ